MSKLNPTVKQQKANDSHLNGIGGVGWNVSARSSDRGRARLPVSSEKRAITTRRARSRRDERRLRRLTAVGGVKKIPFFLRKISFPNAASYNQKKKTTRRETSRKRSTK